MVAATMGPVSAQSSDAARRDYFRAVSGFFNLPAGEVAILGDWGIPPDEIPVVLFMARRAGVSPEALLALRDGGQSWSALAGRYRVTAAALHLPVGDDAPTGGLSAVYEQYRNRPVGEWGAIELTDADIIALVNVRVISQSLRLPTDHVIARVGTTATFVDLYAALKR